MSGVELKMSPQFLKRVKKRYQNYQMEVGVLDNKPHYDAVYVSPLGHGEKTSKKGKVSRIENPYKTLAGGPALKQSQTSSKTVKEVFKEMQEKTGVDVLRSPFKSQKSGDILKLLDNFFKFCAAKNYLTGSPTKEGIKKRLENALQAVVRNPITRGDYGNNTRITAQTKGFSRLFIATGQVFQNIKGRTIKAR